MLCGDFHLENAGQEGRISETTQLAFSKDGEPGVKGEGPPQRAHGSRTETTTGTKEDLKVGKYPDTTANKLFPTHGKQKG